MATPPNSAATPTVPAPRGQYRPVARRPEDAEEARDGGIPEPTTWESTLDWFAGSVKRFFIPMLVVLCVVIIVLLATLLALRPRGPLPGIGRPGEVDIKPGERSTYWDSIELPDFITPIHYDLEFESVIHTPKDSNFRGTVQILVNITKPTHIFVLHAVDLNVSNLILTQVFANQSEGKSFNNVIKENHLDREYCTYVFDQDIAPGIYRAGVAYSARIRTDLRGYYLSNYFSTDTNERRLIASTQFESTDARRGFPCMDEPSKKATFSITMHVQERYHAISNMEIASVGKRSHPLAPKTFVFAKSVPISTYLVAWVVSDFESVSQKTSNNITVSVWTRPGQTDLGKYAVQAGATILDYYQQLFGIPLYLRKLDLIAIPDFSAGAMENPGCITYRDTALLISEGSSPANKQRVAVVVAHELAHLWFGDLVTIRHWNSLSIQEGAAAFFEYLGANSTEPNFDMNRQFYRGNIVRALLSDASLKTHPIHANATNPNEIESLFDPISYQKGSAILRMVQHHLEGLGLSFFGALHQYLEAHKFANADSPDLWAGLSYPEANVSELASNFIFKPGFPLVTVAPIDSARFRLTQQRFFSDPEAAANASNPVYNGTWNIPFSFSVYSNATGEIIPFGEEQNVIVFRGNQTDVEYKPRPIHKGEHILIKPNVRQNGYYRFMLPSTMLRVAAEWLLAHPGGVIGPLDRSGLLEDAMACAMSGYNDNIESALDMLLFLAREHDYHVWGIGMDRLRGLASLLELEPQYGDFRYLVTTLVDSVVKHIGWSERSDDETKFHTRALLRSEMLAFAANVAGHRATIDEALDKFSLLERDPHPPKHKKPHGHKPAKKKVGDDYYSLFAVAKRLGVAPELVAVIVDTAMIHGGSDAEYDILEKYFESAHLTADSLVFLHAMSQASTPHLVTRNVALALSSRIRQQDKVRFLHWVVAAAPTNPQLVLEYMDSHRSDVLHVFGGGGAFSSASELFEALAARMHSRAARDQIQRFVDEKSNLVPGNVVKAVERGLESARNAERWRLRYAQRVLKWVHTQGIPTLANAKLF